MDLLGLTFGEALLLTLLGCSVFLNVLFLFSALRGEKGEGVQ